MFFAYSKFVRKHVDRSINLCLTRLRTKANRYDEGSFVKIIILPRRVIKKMSRERRFFVGKTKMYVLFSAIIALLEVLVLGLYFPG